MTKQHSKAIERQQLDLDKELLVEEQLKASWEACERETQAEGERDPWRFQDRQAVREEVLAQSRRLDARNTVTSFFQVGQHGFTAGMLVGAAKRCRQKASQSSPGRLFHLFSGFFIEFQLFSSLI